MRIILLLWMAIFPVSGWSQMDGARPYRPLHADLFRRVQSSELVAIVTAVERRPVGTRVTDYETPDLGKVVGGTLFKLHIEEILCRKTDFYVKGRIVRPKPETILVFKRYGPGFYEGGHYELGQRYLVFLTVHPEQKDLATKYKLEAGMTYYEAFEGERGLISLEGEEPPPIARIRQFCRAVRATDPNVKILRLTNLRGSGDAALELAIDQAIGFFHQQMFRVR